MCLVALLLSTCLELTLTIVLFYYLLPLNACIHVDFLSFIVFGLSTIRSVMFNMFGMLILVVGSDAGHFG